VSCPSGSGRSSIIRTTTPSVTPATQVGRAIGCVRDGEPRDEQAATRRGVAAERDVVFMPRALTDVAKGDDRKPPPARKKGLSEEAPGAAEGARY